MSESKARWSVNVVECNMGLRPTESGLKTGLRPIMVSGTTTLVTKTDSITN